MMIPTKLAEQVVLLTGVASGIGQAQCQAFLTAGAKVLGVDLKEIELACPFKDHPNFHFMQGDVSQSLTAKKATKLALEKYGRIDILVNTAGILDGFAPTLETTEAQWDLVMGTNLKGTYLFTNEVLPHMLAQKKGTVVNMSSIAGLVAGGGGAAYTASKHAIVGYTKQLDLDYAKQGIRANAIAPGAIRTPMNQADFEGEAEMAKWVASETPAGRWAEPEEVANLTLYLASDLADYIHGTVIPIDGGWLEK